MTAIGLTDIHGRDIAESDTVLVYAQRYERRQLADGTWEANMAKPLAVADVPIARGRVEWCGAALAYVVRYEWVCEAWKGKAAAMMGGGEYAYEKLNGRAA